MIIQYPDLSRHLQKNMAPLYVLSGQDPYVLDDTILQIKNAFKALGSYDEKQLDIHDAQEWASVFQEANHYSLFALHSLLMIRYDKKSQDKQMESAINAYLEKPNQRCLVLIQALQISLKTRAIMEVPITTPRQP